MFRTIESIKSAEEESLVIESVENANQNPKQWSECQVAQAKNPLERVQILLRC